MTLRLVLVSLVAALGLTIPGAPMIESWVASTQNWMNARFADWDTRNPQTADYVIVSDYYDAERLAPRPAISSLPATTPEPSARPGPPNASSATLSSKPALLEDTRSAAVRPRLSYESGNIRADRGWRAALPGHRRRAESRERGDRRGAAKAGPDTGSPVRFDPMPVRQAVYREVQLEWLGGTGLAASRSPGASSRRTRRRMSRWSWPRILWRRRVS